jgi:DNA-binding transcriptional regulator YiaG
MAKSNTPLIRTAGGAWGPQRVALGLSLRALARLSGVNIVTLSLAEQGRLIPTGEEYQAVMQALASQGDKSAA